MGPTNNNFTMVPSIETLVLFASYILPVAILATIERYFKERDKITTEFSKSLHKWHTSLEEKRRVVEEKIRIVEERNTTLEELHKNLQAWRTDLKGREKKLEEWCKHIDENTVLLQDNEKAVLAKVLKKILPEMLQTQKTSLLAPIKEENEDESGGDESDLDNRPNEEEDKA